MTTDETHSLGESLKLWRLQKRLPLEYVALKTRIPLKYLRALEANDFSTLPPIDTVHHTLGDSLRTCREQQGLSLEHIAEQTRISLSYLKALEENDSLHMPAVPVIARGFIDAYLSCLNLPESQKEDLLIQFAKLAETVYAKPQQEPADRPAHLVDGGHQAGAPPVPTFRRRCHELALALYLKIVNVRASLSRRASSAAHSVRATTRQFLHDVAAASTTAGRIVRDAMGVCKGWILVSARGDGEQPAVWRRVLNTLMSYGQRIGHAMVWVYRNTVSRVDWHGLRTRAANAMSLLLGRTDSRLGRVLSKMRAIQWVWMVQYGMTILLLVLFGGIATNIPLFKETALVGSKLDASHLVQFLGYGGALAIACMMIRKAAMLIDRDRSSSAFLRPLVVPLTALLAVSASYKVILVLITPFFSKTDRLAYNWTFVILILAATLWVILTWFFKSAPMLASLESAGQGKQPSSDVAASGCPH